MLREKLKELRELIGFSQRLISSKIDVDSVDSLKMEINNKLVNKIHLNTLSKYDQLIKIELISCFLVEKVLRVLENNDHSIQGLNLVGKTSRM